MTREELIKDFDNFTGYFLDSPIEVHHMARLKFLELLNNQFEKKGRKVSTQEELKDEANENEKPTIMQMFEKLSDSCMTRDELIQLMDDIILTTLNDNHKDVEIAISDKFYSEF